MSLIKRVEDSALQARGRSAAPYGSITAFRTALRFPVTTLGKLFTHTRASETKQAV